MAITFIVFILKSFKVCSNLYTTKIAHNTSFKGKSLKLKYKVSIGLLNTVYIINILYIDFLG